MLYRIANLLDIFPLMWASSKSFILATKPFLIFINDLTDVSGVSETLFMLMVQIFKPYLIIRLTGSTKFSAVFENEIKSVFCGSGGQVV